MGCPGSENRLTNVELHTHPESVDTSKPPHHKLFRVHILVVVPVAYSGFPRGGWTFTPLTPKAAVREYTLYDLVAIRDGQLCLTPLFISSHQLGDITDYFCTSWLIYALFWSYVHFLPCLLTYYVCWIYVLEVQINKTVFKRKKEEIDGFKNTRAQKQIRIQKPTNVSI